MMVGVVDWCLCGAGAIPRRRFAPLVSELQMDGPRWS